MASDGVYVKVGGSYVPAMAFVKAGGIYVSGSLFIKSGGTYVAVTTVTVGGIALESAGAPGTMYEGYTLSWGDDFETLDILAPATPRGAWFPTRTYLPGARGSDTLLSTMFDTDPKFTGHNDSNRGVPVGFNNMTQSASVLNLQARKATAGEQAHMSSVRNEIAAMISGAGLINWYPSSASSGDIIYEARIKFSAAASNPSGWHPTMWLMSLNPVLTYESDEIDWESNADAAYFKRITWTSGADAGYSSGSPHPHDGQFHTIGFIINTTEVKLYVDGVLYATGAWNGNSKSKPQYPLFTSHILNSDWNGDTYNAAEWNADGDGATLSVDWVRVWRRTGRSHFKPLASVTDINVDYGDSVVITIPDKTTLWGDASVTEYLQALYNEENEPGVTHSATYTQFPAGVSYNTGTRELTVNIASGKTGRLNFALAAWKTDGTTSVPLRFAVNVGPVIALSNLSYTAGSVVSYDLYAACDCGVLTSDGTNRAKTISVSGLSGSGLSYNDTTGLLSGTAAFGNFTASVTVTNSAGQSVTGNIAIAISASAPAYESWTGPGWFDASETASVTTSVGNVVSVANLRSGGDNLLAGGTAIAYVAAAQNGLSCFRFTRDTSQNMSRFYAAGLTTSPLATMFQGNDKPYTVISVYKPTDTNTGFIWAVSDTVDATDAQNISLVRRNASASSVRRAVVTATPNDVSWGSGQASGVARIVAVKHTGAAVSVWDNSATIKSVNAVSQDTATFNTELQFRIGAAEAADAIDPTFAGTACAQDFFEIVMESSAKSDADIQQAISDMAAKWGITLS